MDSPHALLGVPPGASAREVAVAYRALAKRLHPDLSGDAAAATARMAELNAAYDALRRRTGRAGAADPPATNGPPTRRHAPDPARGALAPELLRVLESQETVSLVAPVSTWASPRAVLALTDRRLLWLLDDAVAHRVRWLRLRDVRVADYTLIWPRRRRATLRVQARDGRRHSFCDLRPAVAARIAGSLHPPAI